MNAAIFAALSLWGKNSRAYEYTESVTKNKTKRAMRMEWSISWKTLSLYIPALQGKQTMHHKKGDHENVKLQNA